MKTVMFVLLSAVTLLLQPHSARSSPIQPGDYLKSILMLAEQCNASLTQRKFVEDVSSLAEASSCGDKFLCKVEQILNKEHVCKADIQVALKRNLKGYHLKTNINCTATLQGVNNAQQMQVSDLLQNVKDCVRRKYFEGKK